MAPKLPDRVEESLEKDHDLGLLLLRLGAGFLMAWQHGLPKLLAFAGKSPSFSDPLGMTPAVSMGMAIFAEFFCSLAIMLGFYTRLAVLPLLFTMGMAAFVIHAEDPFKVKEKALLFGVMYLAILVAGPGRFALSRLIARRQRPG